MRRNRKCGGEQPNVGHKETGCVFLLDSLVRSRLNGSCKSAETRESGGAVGAGKVNEKCLLR